MGPTKGLDILPRLQELAPDLLLPVEAHYCGAVIAQGFSGLCGDVQELGAAGWRLHRSSRRAGSAAPQGLFPRLVGSAVVLKIRRWGEQLNVRHGAEGVNELSLVNSQ